MSAQSVSPVLFDYAPISLDEMGGVKLMNRTDTKYLVSLDTLNVVLQRALPYYRAQEVCGERAIGYRTVYFDTPDCAMFIAHQNGHAHRQKVRVRTYVSSNLSFLEVKDKSNKGRTAKKRIRVQGINTLETDGGIEFLHRTSRYELSELSPQLENHFHRITLVNKGMTERLTIDTAVQFHRIPTNAEACIETLAIIELKRDGLTWSPIREILRSLHVKSASFSKYCIGLSLTDPTLKRNRFKKKVRWAEKVARIVVSPDILP